jgi:hypothetical protein
MKDFIEEVIYLYHAVYNPGYFKKNDSRITYTTEGVKIPISTEGIKHRENEPISFIIFAKDDQTFAEFLKKTGFFGEDPITFFNSIRGVFCNFLNLPYDKFQLTPYFWNGKRHNYALQKPTGNNTVRERHHARFWSSDLITKSKQKVFVAMASFDGGMKFFSHTIDPEIDKEREYFFSEFQKTKMIKRYKKIKLMDNIKRNIFNGDLYFTDGFGYIIYL